MCRLKKQLHIVLILLFLSVKTSFLHAQACVDDYFSEEINTLTVQEPNDAIVTSQQEMLVAGDVLKYNSILKEGWLTKYSAKGNVLWTRRYYTSSYNYVVFNSVTEAESETFLVGGNIGDVDTASWPVVHLSQYAFLMKVDKYGNIIWAKTLGRVYIYTAFSDVQSMLVTKNGDYILSLSYSNEFINYSIVTALDKEGNIKWLTSLESTEKKADLGISKLRQLRNGNILFITSVSQYNSKYNYRESGCYIATINTDAGTRIWERFYVSVDSLLPLNVYDKITGITEFPNGSISFITSYASEKINNFRFTRQVLSYTVDSEGNFLKVAAYKINNAPYVASSAIQTNEDGSRVVLMDNADNAFLMKIDSEGKITWQNSFPSLGRSLETRIVLTTQYGYYFLCFVHDGGNKQLKLIKTDINGNIPCIQTASAITMQYISFASIHTLKLVYQQPGGVWNQFAWMNSTDYMLNQNFNCRKACCTDITDTAEKKNLCDTPYFILANNDTIRNSGTYSVVFKASTGCDSIVYYNINFAVTPKVSLGTDRCMGEKDTIIISATPGFNEYAWNGTRSLNATLSIQQPGAYNVTVTNNCGTAKDTLMVFKECAYEIKMPNAFTPNGDNTNDIFRVPSQVNNRLISFTVFNRWGQIMFHTTDMSKGWDGRFQNAPAPAGTYVYYVVMKSLDNRKNVSGKGYVTLLR